MDSAEAQKFRESVSVNFNIVFEWLCQYGMININKYDFENIEENPYNFKLKFLTF